MTVYTVPMRVYLDTLEALAAAWALPSLEAWPVVRLAASSYVPALFA